jgi:uncharacterized protein HemX
MEEQEKQINNEMSEDQLVSNEKVEEKTVGAIIGVIIIVVIIIIGGLYFFFKQNKTQEEIPVETTPTAEEIAAEPDNAIQALETQGTSDKITDIEADLGNTDLKNLDIEMGNIEAELNL